MPENDILTKCAEDGCTAIHLGTAPGNSWSYGFEPHGRALRFCPRHSTAEHGAVAQPSPFDLAPNERATFEAGHVDPKDFIGVTLAVVDLSFRQDDAGNIMLVCAAPMPPVMHVFRSRLLGPDGQPGIRNVEVALPPAIRLVVPRRAVIDGALKEADELRASPKLIRSVVHG